MQLLSHYLQIESVPSFLLANPQILFTSVEQLKEVILFLRRRLDKALVSEILQVGAERCI